MASTLRFDNWEDSNGTPILDGTNLALPSSALPTGSVLQVVSKESSDSFSSTVGDTWLDTPLNATITPKFNNSKILVLVMQPMRFRGANDGRIIGSVRLLRDSTPAWTPVVDFLYVIYSPDDYRFVSNITHLDSPATNASITYTTQMIQRGGRNQIMSTDILYPRMILMEIAG